jgi:tetratricopeptide (TPR) repeat protein
LLLVAGGLAAGAGWIRWCPAADPSPSHVPAPTPAAVVATPAAASVAPRLVPGTPPAPLAAIPDPALRAQAATLAIRAADARAQGDLRAVLDLLQAAVERAPAVETHAALGAFYLELGAAAAAEPHLQTAVEGDPGNADRWIALANALALKPDPMAAAAALERARGAEPGLRVTRDADGRLVRTPTS